MLREMGVSVIYPGLKEHPQHHLVKEMGNEEYGAGGILAIDCMTGFRRKRWMNLQRKTHS